MTDERSPQSVYSWRKDPDAPTPPCPKCGLRLGIRLGVFRDNGRDAWLCDKCGEWEIA